jgi:hypothetical protein
MLNEWWEPPEKLKSHDDDQTEHLRCGGIGGVSMQRNVEYCMHKVHRSYKYIVQRRDWVVVAAGVVVDVVVEGDSCMKKDQSAAAEKHKKKNCAANGHGAQSIKSRRTEWAVDACWKTVRKSE